MEKQSNYADFYEKTWRQYHWHQQDCDVTKLGNICKDVLALHALAGCYSVSFPFGKSETIATNLMMKEDLNLDEFCWPDISNERLFEVGSNFFARLYGGKRGTHLDGLRYQIIMRKEEPPKI